MDVDRTDLSPPTTSNTRLAPTDPRLSRLSAVSQPPSQNKTSPTVSPSTSPVIQQNAATAPSITTPAKVGQIDSGKATTDAPLCDFSHIVPLLNQLIDSRATLLWSQTERAAVEKEDALLWRNLGRAKALSGGFPALVESLQSMADNAPTGLQKLESELTKQQTKCSDMAEKLRSMLHVAPPPLENDKTATLKAQLKEELRAELQQEWTSAKDTLANELKEKLWKDLEDQIRAEAQETRAASGSPSENPHETIPAGDKEKSGTLERSLQFVSQSNQKLSTRILQLEKWKKQVDEGQDRSPIPSKAPVEPNDQTPSQIKLLEEQISTLQERLGKSEQAQSQWLALHNQTRYNTSVLQKLQAASDPAPQDAKINHPEEEARNIRADLKGTQADLTLLKSQPRESNTEAQAALQTAFHDLEAKYRTLNEQLMTLRSLRVDLGGVLESLQGHRDAIQNLFVQINKVRGPQETMKTAIRSLEHRYSNITSENLVKSMTHAMHEMYPSLMQKHVDQLNALQSQLDSNKAEVTQEIDSLRKSRVNEGAVPAAAAPEQLNDISERLAQLQETQKTQAADIVRHLREISELREQFDAYKNGLDELGDKQAEDVSDQSRDMKVLGSRIDKHDSQFESLTRENKDAQGFVGRLKHELESMQELVSEERVKRLCDETQAAKLQDIASRMQVFNSQGDLLLKTLATIQEGFTHSGPDRDSLKALTNGLLSGPSKVNTSSIQPQNGTAATQNDQSGSSSSGNPRCEISAMPRTGPSESLTTNGSASRASDVDRRDPAISLQRVSEPDNPELPPSSASSTTPPNPGRIELPAPDDVGSLPRASQINMRDAPTPHRSYNSSTAKPNQPNSASEKQISSRVEVSLPSGNTLVAGSSSATVVPGLQTRNVAPINNTPSNLSTQIVAGKKRVRQSTASEDESRQDERKSGSSVSRSSAKPSPTPSSAPEISARKLKKAKKEKRQQS